MDQCASAFTLTLLLSFASGVHVTFNGELSGQVQPHHTHTPRHQAERGGTSCEGDWLFYQGHCYKYYNTNPGKTYDAAEDICQQDGPNGHLVSFNDEEEFQFLILSYSLGSNLISIGLLVEYEEAEDGFYEVTTADRWIDGSNVTFSNWPYDNYFESVINDGPVPPEWFLAGCLYRSPHSGRLSFAVCFKEWPHPFICEVAAR